MELQKELPQLIILPNFSTQKDNLKALKVILFKYGFHRRRKRRIIDLGATNANA